MRMIQIYSVLVNTQSLSVPQKQTDRYIMNYSWLMNGYK